MDSLKTASILKCGHAIHSQCKDDLLLSGNPRCPICNSSFPDMDSTWKVIDGIIAQTPMPEEHCLWKVEILCADGHEKSKPPFHVEGLKCGACGGYNTTRCGNEEPPQAPAEQGQGGPTGDGAGEGGGTAAAGGRVDGGGLDDSEQGRRGEV